MAPRCYRGRQATYVVNVPADWKPQRPWTFPPTFSSGELIAKNLSASEARGFASAHNAAELKRIQSGRPTGRWAIVVRHLKPNYHGDRHLAGKGGAK